MTDDPAFADLEAERLSLPTAVTDGDQVAIRDAGTLVIVDEAEGTAKVLMGRRAGGHVFMPGRYVFPGGRVDPADRALAADFPLDADQLRRLCAETAEDFDAKRAAATALAAIRETFEETGALVGEPGALDGAKGFWSAFAEKALRPAPRRLVPFARAITPPGPPRRYDTRFFCVPASAMAVPPSLDALPTDELEDVAWVLIEALDHLSIAPITLRILAELKRRIGEGSWQDSSRPMPVYRLLDGQFTRTIV